MKRIITLLTTAICLWSCDDSMTDYDVQPDIPMYKQLLLKGNVQTVTETIESEFGTSTESYTFDKSGKLIYHSWNGEEWKPTADTRSMLFPWICGTYAYFVFPDDWTKYDNRTETRTFSITENGEVTRNVEKKIEYEWDRSTGRFTKVRCYKNNELVALAGIENGYNIEEYLYYSNGLPHYDFNFAEELCLITELTYDNFDEYSNPLVINISTPNGDVTITRQIEYFK